MEPVSDLVGFATAGTTEPAREVLVEVGPVLFADDVDLGRQRLAQLKQMVNEISLYKMVPL
jgi:hypothetical protein